METVEVVIRIPKREVEEIKRYCKRVELKISSLEDYIYRSIANGTVLPKGHGDLIDKDKLWDAYQDMGQDFYQALDCVSAIIEADEGGRT